MKSVSRTMRSRGLQAVNSMNAIKGLYNTELYQECTQRVRWPVQRVGANLQMVVHFDLEDRAFG